MPLIELGNHAPHSLPEDGAPCVTTIHIPDADETGAGGYTHEPGLTANEFRSHYTDALLYRGGITHLPEHEALLAIVNAWPRQGREKPAWVKVHHREDVYTHQGVKKGALTTKKAAGDLEQFLREFYQLENEKPADVEDRYHTKFGPPGDGGPGYGAAALPDATAMFLNDGRVQQANNYGGGQVGDTGQLTASSATTATTGKTYTLNQWAGYRVVASVSGSQLVWGNIVSNTAGAASVLTVDRWYNAATPGGVAGSTPSATGSFMILDGGVVSAWFVGLSTTNYAPSATEHGLTGEYTAAGGGLIRKIAPFALTSGVSPMGLTLTPVFTANGSDTLPATFYVAGAFTSMVVADTTLTCKFASQLNASQTVGSSGDQLTVTWTETGS